MTDSFEQAAEQAIALAETFRARAEVAESRLREMEFACLEIYNACEEFNHAPDAESECVLCRALALALSSRSPETGTAAMSPCGRCGKRVKRLYGVGTSERSFCVDCAFEIRDNPLRRLPSPSPVRKGEPMTEIQEGSKVAPAAVDQLRQAMTTLAENPHVSEEEFAAVCDAHLAVSQALFAKVDALEAVADAAREVERILSQSGVTDSRIADLRTALRALSSEDATRPKYDEVAREWTP